MHWMHDTNAEIVGNKLIINQSSKMLYAYGSVGYLIMHIVDK